MLDFFLSFFVFGFLPMVHSLHVQMDSFTHGNFCPKLTRD
jgi:hypothetical protein